MIRHLSSRFRTFAVLVLAVLAVGAAVPAAATTTPVVPELTNIRVGAHDTFDRVVLDLNGSRPEFFIRCVDQLYYDGSGLPVSMPGSTFLEVRSFPAAAHDEWGNPTYTGPRQFTTPSLSNVQAVAITGDYEGNLTIGLGMRQETWHRVFLLSSPTRLVIDVGAAH
ncbi:MULTISPECIES: AMIN-like domain-containing (lipo)protein [unclassified Saccharothrix]|uniref:AMIN-like domain-containing (lipo)protein n=1 Tax=unclassified Saccharothrix TaxID=2593673 RepID=UPI00307D51AE